MAPGAIFHTLRTLRTANCTFFDTVMVELFDIKVNIANHNHKELLNFDHNCYERHLESPRFEINTFMTSFNVTKIPNTSPLDVINDGINNGPFCS